MGATLHTRKLEHLIALTETRNFRKAADVVHLSQPALSRSLRALELELGVELFDRSHGEISPNTFGKAVCEHARRIQFELRELDRTVRQMKGLEEGELRVGLGPMVAAILLPGVLVDIVTRYPKLRIVVNIASGKANLRMLKDDRLDIAVFDTRVVESGDNVAIDDLPQHRFAFVVRPQHPLLDIGRNANITDLKDFPVGAPTLPPALAKIVRESGLDQLQTVTCDDVATLLHLAAASDLVALVSRPIAVSHFGKGALAELPVDLPFDMHSHIGLVHVAGRTLGPAGNLFVDLITKRLSE